MTRKISVLSLFLFALCLAPRASFASTVTLTLESANGSPYDFSVNGSSTDVTLSCLNDQREVNVGETWTATATNLETIIQDPADITGSGMTVAELKADAYLDSKYITTSSSPTITLDNQEVQDAIWSILDGTDVYSGLTGGNSGSEDTAVRNLISAANSTTETSAFYSQFTFYAPLTYNQGNDDDQSHSIPQQFLGYSPTVTPEPSSLILLGTGLAGLAGSVRRRYAKLK